MVTLAVDCMGGDHGPSITLPACRQFLDSHPDAHLLLVGLPQALAGFVHPRAVIVPVTAANAVSLLPPSTTVAGALTALMTGTSFVPAMLKVRVLVAKIGRAHV